MESKEKRRDCMRETERAREGKRLCVRERETKKAKKERGEEVCSYTLSHSRIKVTTSIKYSSSSAGAERRRKLVSQQSTICILRQAHI